MSTETNAAKTLRLPEVESSAKAGRDSEPEGPIAVEDLEKLATSVDATEKRRRKMALLLLAAVLVLIGSIYFAWRAFQYEDTDDAQIDGHIMPLSARITGQIQEVRVIEGQLVHAGDVLVTIDQRDYKIAVAQAQANVADAEATAASSHWNVPITAVSTSSNLASAETAIANAEAGVAAAEQNLESAKADVEQAEANAAKSDADLVRYRQLVAKEDISRQQYDQANATAIANRAAVVSDKAAALAAEQTLRQQQGKLLQAKADLRSAQTAPQQVSLTRAKALAADAQAVQRKTQLDQAELNLSFTVIRSPVTGIVGKKSVEVGQNVSVGQELVDVVPLDDIWVTANFKETQLAHMEPGQPVEIKVDAYGRKWKGHVSNLGGGTGSVFSLLPPENATGNYVKVVQRVPVRIDFDRVAGQSFNADGLLKPGLSVDPDVRVR
ncbi:MAG TPA: HlyD family secretion protein [Terriglobales bacterium]|jgi:membrane fusion protein (multidrug efflux system)|nr:HlyD family secretion protein [Terriglobales bacterium]